MPPSVGCDRETQQGKPALNVPTDGGSFDVEYFDQLAAEKLITKYRYGRPHQEWQQTRPRNEALDCLVCALAALRLAGLSLDHTASIHGQPASQVAIDRRRQFIEQWNDRQRNIMRRL